MFGLSPSELVVVGIVAVLLFGSKLPDVARSLGKSYNDFKKGMNDIQDQFREAERDFKRTLDQPKIASTKSTMDNEEFEEPTAPKFTPPA